MGSGCDQDEYERLRLRRRFVSRRASVGQGSKAWAGRVTTIAPVVGKFLTMVPVNIGGVEGEGLAAIVTDRGPSTIAYLAGPGIPATGDILIARMTDYRWVVTVQAPGNGGGGSPVYGIIPGCSCTTIPATLHMSSSGPCYPGDFQACTLVFGPTPSQFSALGLGANCFLSTTDFQDPTQAPPYGLFRYTMGCSANFFSLSRVYEPVGSSIAYHDTTIYTWAIGVTGNTCSPFLLSVGTIYAGGNPACLVVISG